MSDFHSGVSTVVSPATSANLGPGFDAFGLALGLHDRVEGAVVGDGLSLRVEGEGASTVARDESHLVVSSMRATFDALGVPQPGLRVTCHNAVPHGRGLGSSASAIVSGIRLAEALVDGARLSDAHALALASEIEGHPDNVAACLSGAVTIAWWAEPGAPACVRLEVHPDIRPVVFIPEQPVSTEVARGLLPPSVSHQAASANAGRAALLVAALTTRPDQLMAATEDRLHQEFRRPAMPSSLELVEALRGAGLAAVISGAGPTVLALTTSQDHDLTRFTPAGWRCLDLPVDRQGAVVVP